MAALGFDHPIPALAPINTTTAHRSPPPPSYELLDEINRGSFGVVYRARDVNTGNIVAAKHELHGFSFSTKTEVRILASLPRHPSVVELKDTILEDSGRRRVFVIMEYIPNDLAGFMRSMKPLKFTISQVKRMAKGLLEGVSFLHDNGVMHRDLKPNNILIDPDKGDFKICDFGLSRAFDPDQPAGPYSPRVGTRSYKAPELLLRANNYSCAVDMWSVGCIIAEMMLGEVLFRGSCEVTQIMSIFDVLGSPDEVSWPGFTDLTENQISFQQLFEPQPHNRLRLKFENSIFFGCPCLTDCGYDLIAKLLTYDPCKRISAREALKHPWFTELDPEVPADNLQGFTVEK